jgi:hypothetical protein
MNIPMNRTRWIGVALWAGSLVCLLIAVGFGVAVAQDMIAKALGISLTVGFGLAAEAMFWAGGAALGLSFFAKRGSWLSRLFARRAASDPQA